MEVTDRPAPPEGWLWVIGAKELFMEATSDLFREDIFPHDGSPRSPEMLDFEIVLEAFARRECAALFDHAPWAIVDKHRKIVRSFETMPVTRGFFDVHLGLLGKRETVLSAMKERECEDTRLPLELGPLRGYPVVIDHGVWRHLIRAWRAERMADQAFRENGAVDFSDVRDEWIGRWIIEQVTSARKEGRLSTMRDSNQAGHGLWDTLSSWDIGDRGKKSLSERRFKEIWKQQARKPENRHLGMGNPGRPMSKK